MDINTIPKKDLILTIFLYVQLGDEEKLDHTLFVLSAQKYQPIEILITIDGLVDGEYNQQLEIILRRWNKNFLRLVTMPPLRSPDQFWTIEKLLPFSHGHYLAFLAAGQKIYPNLYSSLIKCLQNSLDCTWAFCDVVMVHYNQFNQVNKRWTPFIQEQYALAEHLRLDFIPIHSVVIERLRAPKLQNCSFQFKSQYHHAILLYLADKYCPLSLAIIGAEESSPHAVGQDYSYIAKEIENRYLLSNRYSSRDIRSQEIFSNNKKRYPFLDKQFDSQLQAFELKYDPESFYFRSKLKLHYESLSWRVTKPLRNIFKLFRGLPLDIYSIPECELEASEQIMQVEKSTSWRLTRILRITEELNKEPKRKSPNKTFEN
jgi:hypothetical protein